MDRAFRDDQEFIVRGQNGSVFKGRTGILQAYPFSVQGYYDWRNCAIALALCSEGDTVVEIGANIGTETVYYANIVGPSGMVYAFEPFENNITSLRETLALNPDLNVRVKPYAVGERCTTVDFVVPERKNNHGVGHIAAKDETISFKTARVPCVTLDSMEDETGAISMIFMEVEGAEVMVLRGARDCISRHKPGIVFEATPDLLARAGYSLADLYGEIRRLDYEPFRVSRLGLAAIRDLDREERRRPANWLCLHSSKVETVKIATRSIALCGMSPCFLGLNPLGGRTSQIRNGMPC
jgi:FkbM family methyltransferase